MCACTSFSPSVPLTLGRRTTSEAAASSADLRKKKELYASALDKLKACQEDGARMVKENAGLASVDVLVGGLPTRPQEVMAQCAQKAAALQAHSPPALRWPHPRPSGTGH